MYKINNISLLEEQKEITDILKRLRELRDSHKYSIRHYYNDVCDRLDVLESKLYNLSCDNCKHNISSVCLGCTIENKSVGWEE
jgi:hypothetical protein